MLEARGLWKRFGDQAVVCGVDLSIPGGAITGLLGPNGTGKTTTVRLLTGRLPLDAGEIRYFGEPFAENRSRIKRQIGVCTQHDTLDHDLTVRQNLLTYAGYFRPRVPRLDERVETLLTHFDLQPFAARSPQVLSGGYRQRLLIARALIHEPKVLFLDEPTTGLDPKARMQLWHDIDALRRDGLAVVLTTHYMDEAERLCDQLVVLRGGRVLTEGAPREVLGAMLGEQVLVLPAGAVGTEAFERFRAAHGLHSTYVLGESQTPVSPQQLEAFRQAFPGTHPYLRPPNLDDLFLRLEAQSGQAA